ncbi:tripartite tricarboxylate transporter TctB family protein [Cellulosimicrobium funkei]|nr:tripartite tricarboxylate transporter TctB family protein [Cellulosimicrobium funkei]
MAVYQSVSLGVGDLSNPGPGLWPLFVSGATLTLSIVLLVLGVNWASSPAGGQRWVVSSIAAFAVYVLILPIFGFFVATVPVAFFFVRVIGGAGWVASIATAVLAPAAAFYIFDQLLGVPLMSSSLW